MTDSATPPSRVRHRRWARLCLASVIGVPLACTDNDGKGKAAPPVRPWFTEITDAGWLDFVHESGAAGDYHVPEEMGPGAVLFDADNDGDLDVYLITGNHELPGIEPAAEPTNRFYRQSDDGAFLDVTTESGLDDGGYGMGAAIGDIDNDGDVDLYLTNFGADRLFLNRGDGTFKDTTAEAGIDVPTWSCSAAFFDYDRDGFLDLFVTQYIDYDPAVLHQGPASMRDYLIPSMYAPIHDVLLHNNGDGTFDDVSEKAGIASVSAAGLGVVCEDFDGDGWIDVYVANDAYGNHLWRNNHDGTFTDIAIIMAAAYNLHGQPEAGMGVNAADIDNDLDLDLFMTHVSTESNTLYENLGDQRGFADVTGERDLAASSMRHTGFGTVAIDIEHDGDLDLVVVNGRIKRQEAEPGAIPGPPWTAYAEPNLLYQNGGDGRFDLRRDLGGALCSQVEVTRGLAAGDIDGDGDLDLLLANVHGPARVFRNDAPHGAQNGWVMIRAVDPRLRRDAIGARITVSAGGRTQRRTVNPATGYLSVSDMRTHFGLGDATVIDIVEVEWVDGLVERFSGLEVNRLITLWRGDGEARR